MKKSKQVESFWIEEYPNGIYHILFKTKDRWVYYHRFNNEMFQIGGTPDEDEGYIQELKEDLIPEDGSLICMTTQSKDQISFYFIPKKMIFNIGEKIIFDSLKDN